MPKINWNKVDDFEDYTPAPPGIYIAEAVEIEERKTKAGDDMWLVKWQIVEPAAYKGRMYYDNIVFSPMALKRAKLICARLGLSVEGEVDLEPRHIRGKTCKVILEKEEYTTDTGAVREKNVVPFAGYLKADDPRPLGPSADIPTAASGGSSPAAAGAEAGVGVVAGSPDPFSEENLPF